MQNRIGQQFGNYRLLRLLGSGGFAEVYLGEHVYLRSNAAVKVLYGPLATSDAQSFLQEAQTLARLEHANIVGIKEFNITQGIPSLVMNYASNGTLRQRHPRGQRVPLGTIVSYVLQVASALQYAHNRQIVHRDVKPENMLIDNNGMILLSDFGIATLSSSSSRAGAGAGTPLYIAPEQSAGKALPASDQYALGITVYEWLCGEAPFVGTPSEIISRHLNMPPQPLSQRGVLVGPQVEAVIARALAKDPSQRFASVQQFAQALQSSSNALPGNNNMPLPAPGSNNSILPAPFYRAPDFSNPSAPPTQPHPTPHITPIFQPPTSGLPPSPPTVYPGYAPTQPAPQYVPPRKTGFPCLATALISVVVIIVIVIGSTLTIRLVPLPLSPGAMATSTQTPTSSPAATATPTPTQTPNPSPTATTTSTPRAALTPVDAKEINDVDKFMSLFCFNLGRYAGAFDSMSIQYKTRHHRSDFDSAPFSTGGGGGCENDFPIISNNVCTVVFSVGAAKYTATIIHDPDNSGNLAVDNIQ